VSGKKGHKLQQHQSIRFNDKTNFNFTTSKIKWYVEFDYYGVARTWDYYI